MKADMKLRHVTYDPPFEAVPPGEPEARLAAENRELKGLVGDLRREKYELQSHVARLEREKAALEELALKKRRKAKKRRRPLL